MYVQQKKKAERDTGFTSGNNVQTFLLSFKGAWRESFGALDTTAKGSCSKLHVYLNFMLYPINEHKFVLCSVTVFLTLKMFFPEYLKCLFVVSMCAIMLFCTCPEICIPHFDRHKLQCLEFLSWANSLGKVLKGRSAYFTKERE